MAATQSSAEGLAFPHHLSDFPSSPSLSHLCHCLLTSDVDLDFPAVLAPSCGDPALPEPRVCLRQVPHLKLAGDFPRLNDGFDELWAHRVHSALRLSPPATHSGLKLQSRLVGKWMLLGAMQVGAGVRG